MSDTSAAGEWTDVYYHNVEHNHDRMASVHVFVCAAIFSFVSSIKSHAFLCFFQWPTWHSLQDENHVPSVTTLLILQLASVFSPSTVPLVLAARTSLHGRLAAHHTLRWFRDQVFQYVQIVRVQKAENRNYFVLKIEIVDGNMKRLLKRRLTDSLVPSHLHWKGWKTFCFGFPQFSPIFLRTSSTASREAPEPASANYAFLATTLREASVSHLFQDEVLLDGRRVHHREVLQILTQSREGGHLVQHDVMKKGTQLQILYITDTLMKISLVLEQIQSSNGNFTFSKTFFRYGFSSYLRWHSSLIKRLYSASQIWNEMLIS